MLPALREQSRTVRDVILLGEGEAEGVLRADVLAQESAPVDDAGACGDDLAGVFYTGGTTGHPKGVRLSHNNLIGGAVGRLLATPPGGDVFLHAAPMFHIAGLLGALWHMTLGGTHVIIPAFTPLAFMEAVQRERVTDSILVPVMIQMLLDHPEFQRYDLSSLRMLSYGASPISEKVLERAMHALPGLQLLQAYGMTELSGPATFLTPHYHTPQGLAQGKLRSAGVPSALSDVRVVDDEGFEVPRGTPGEIVVRGMTVMLGYWNRPTEQSRALRDGWMHTGDIGVMDEQGFLRVVDRLKDMIVSGGENVYSAEVENALASHPAVAGSAVIGIPSERWGESVHAVVVLRPDAEASPEALIGHCKQSIAGYKCPRSIEVVAQLPLSAAGKVLKHKLREPYWHGRQRGVN